MSDDIPFDRTPPQVGRIDVVSDRLRRVVAPNGGPFTFTGTCSYIVGRGRVAIVDPGPADPAHIARLLDAVRGESVDAVIVTHTHRDHSPAAAAVSASTGAKTYGAGRHRSARPLRLGEINALDASADHDFVPDVILGDGDAVTGPDWTLTAIATPGHCANHLALSLAQDGVLLSGDHVMAWSTSIVAPPDGAMGDYMTSLQKLLGRAEQRYFPGHGGPVGQPQAFLRALIAHRRMREASILKALAAGDGTISAIVARVYEGLRPELVGAAALNTLAHLEDLCARGVARTDGAPAMDGRFAVAG
ncbi:MBL fold metallo-hydrolase [Labrys wisconsinensis]|uniref:Glyoxylase-like metal-dependent hydrolase (Beta-lactamase superfamily II) n=1 Tax=Labrys wisconsinensis TaxID=425677 RepID=A0ABU0JQC2_9HYPH|nr:MBL fold metallo-hydrolase [Labrys wisconsinensis]MDQ0475469.1 glyoxylase-like metal-dependent hydrolase (beta-lactamase superfamily II) [Labrys wisconsinensis]